MALYGTPFQGRVENNAALYDKTVIALYGIPFQGRVENNAALYDRPFMALYVRPFQGELRTMLHLMTERLWHFMSDRFRVS